MIWDFIVYGAECEWRLFVRSLSFCTLSSEHIISSRFCVTWITSCFQWQWPELSRKLTIMMWDFIVYGAECEWSLFVRSLSFCMHPFQWTHNKQQILCYLNDMVLSMTEMWDVIAYGREYGWRLLVRSLSFCTLSSEHVLSSRFCVTWITWCFQWQWP